MSVPLLRLSDNFNSYISGEVDIHPSAVIAPGVILQTTANSKIIIGAGVCIGMGSILQVSEGIIEIEAGANLGAGFLMVGQGKIGANACIGSATTVFNCSVAPEQVVPPGSILGDSSRQISEPVPEDSNQQVSEPAQPETNPQDVNLPNQPPQKKVVTSTNFTTATFVAVNQQSTTFSPPSPTPKSQSPPVEPTTPEADTNSNSQESTPNQPQADNSNSFGTQIYGQGSINRLLVTLFPHRQSLSNPNSDNTPE
ncbi:MAG TPA: transferase [Nostocaceae cyanobacterium]|nr:transferase [Nostocaceae cyanobacterium]